MSWHHSELPWASGSRRIEHVAVKAGKQVYVAYEVVCLQLLVF